MSKEFREINKPRPKDEQADFVMTHVDEAAKRRRPLEDIWDETESNFLVRPLHEQSLSNHTRYPLATNMRDFRASTTDSILKDPETHQEVMTIVSGIITSVMPENTFIRAIRQGTEDIYRAKTVNKLLEYFFRLEGHYYSMVEWLLGAGIYGTGIGETYWDYVEQPRTFRKIDVDYETGGEFSEESVMVVPVWDDPRFETFDIRNFYPDTGQHQLHRMKGAGSRVQDHSTRCQA